MKLKALLSIFLIITFLPAIGYAADEDSVNNNLVYQQQYELLKGIGVISDTEILEDVESLTRAQFVSLIVDAANVVQYETVTDKPYTDVLEKHSYFDDIYLCVPRFDEPVRR